MGGMKAFASRLAKMVYERRMTDQQIINEFASNPQAPDELWLRQQIRTVRSNPQIYKAMTGVS
jgi:hypothetical protein